MIGSASAAPFIQQYFAWMPVGDLHIDAAFQLDQLSIMMMLVITGVGSLIHLFSVGYMRDDPGYPRYFAYLNLFVFFMLVLVLGRTIRSSSSGGRGWDCVRISSSGSGSTRRRTRMRGKRRSSSTASVISVS